MDGEIYVSCDQSSLIVLKRGCPKSDFQSLFGRPFTLFVPFELVFILISFLLSRLKKLIFSAFGQDEAQMTLKKINKFQSHIYK